MRRVSMLAMARVLVVSLASILLAAASAHAAPVTVNISGTVDLSVAGLPSNSIFSGFFSWESTDGPFESSTDPFNPNAAENIPATMSTKSRKP